MMIVIIAPLVRSGGRYFSQLAVKPFLNIPTFASAAICSTCSGNAESFCKISFGHRAVTRLGRASIEMLLIPSFTP